MKPYLFGSDQQQFQTFCNNVRQGNEARALFGSLDLGILLHYVDPVDSFLLEKLKKFLERRLWSARNQSGSRLLLLVCFKKLLVVIIYCDLLLLLLLLLLLGERGRERERDYKGELRAYSSLFSDVFGKRADGVSQPLEIGIDQPDQVRGAQVAHENPVLLDSDRRNSHLVHEHVGVGANIRAIHAEQNELVVLVHLRSDPQLPDASVRHIAQGATRRRRR